MLSELQQKTQDADICIMVCQTFGSLLYTYLQPLTGADDVSGESWQLVTTSIMMDYSIVL